MIRRSSRARLPALLPVAVAPLLALAASAAAQAQTYPVTPQQRSTAQQVAQAGVALSELAPNAPDEYTVKRGDTLWDISKLFLKSPWRWPELWGMNLDQIRNPHLIYPGQMLFLDRSGGRARLRVGEPTGTVKLSPRVRAEPLDGSAIPAVPMHLIAPFLNEAVVFNANELESAPRIVAAQEGRVLLGRGDTAYVRGEVGGLRDWRVFREATPLKDPLTKEVLGYEAQYLGTAEFRRAGGDEVGADGKPVIVPSSFTVTSIRKEIGVGDRLAPVAARDFSSYVPHAPAQPVEGSIVSVYGDGLMAGQNQIVAINRGGRDGMERGHVLALWSAGTSMRDSTDPAKAALRLPDERQGMLFVFRVFDRVSYALILQVRNPVRAGDRFTQP